MNATRARRFAAECTGTAGLLVAVAGSGIMGERLAGGNVAIALLANSAATGAALLALILALGPVSGAHFNPIVSLTSAAQRRLPWRDLPGYVGAQMLGAVLGVATAHLMFELPILSVSQHARSGLAQCWSEVVATFGLLATIGGCVRSSPAALPFAVGAYIGAAYWFTASTSFANPAVTLARALTDTFTGIRPADVPPFIIAQLLGAAVALAWDRWIHASVPARSDRAGAGSLEVETPGVSGSPQRGGLPIHGAAAGIPAREEVADIPCRGSATCVAEDSPEQRS